MSFYQNHTHLNIYIYNVEYIINVEDENSFLISFESSKISVNLRDGSVGKMAGHQP